MLWDSHLNWGKLLGGNDLELRFKQQIGISWVKMATEKSGRNFRQRISMYKGPEATKSMTV